MSRENYSKYLQNKDSDILHSTGYSNSRLGGNFCTTPHPELNFDAMTIVGNLNKNNDFKSLTLSLKFITFKVWSDIKLHKIYF